MDVPASLMLKLRRRHKKLRFQSGDVKIHLLELPRLLQLSFVVCRLLSVSKNREKRLATVRDVDTIYELVIFDHRFGAGLPENVSVFLGCLDREQA